MAATAIDAGYIAASYAIPETTVQSLLDEPTADLVRSFLESVSRKAKEYDALKADKLRTDVELENAVHGSDSRVRGLKATVDKTFKELEELRVKLAESENARSALESELQTLKSSTSNSTSELDTLRQRISTLEALNRDLSAQVETKSTAQDRLAEDLSTQQQKINQLKRDIAGLEEKNTKLENDAAAGKFKEGRLKEEIELLKKSRDWHAGELETRTAEFNKQRRELRGKVSELQRQKEDADASIDSMKRTDEQVRKRLAELGEKADNAFARIQQLEEEAARKQESFTSQIDNFKRLAELQKEQAESARRRVEELQTELDSIRDQAAEEIGQMQAETDTERSHKEVAEHRVSELELQIENLENQLSHMQRIPSVPATPRRTINGNGTATPARAGSPAAFTPGASRMKGSVNFTQLYAENSTLKAELDGEKRRNEKLTTTIDDMIQELESKQPEIEELRADHERLSAEVIDLTALLEEANAERDAMRRDIRTRTTETEALSTETAVLRQQLRDLSMQVQVLLMEMQAREQGLESFSAEDQEMFQRIVRGEIDDAQLEGMTDTDRFISQRLIIFRNVKELQEQNARLLRLTRELGERMEGEEARAKQNQQEKDRQELGNLRERVERLKDELKTLTTQSQSFVRERDMYRRMLAHRGQLPPDADLGSMFGQSVDGRAATPGAQSTAESIGAKEMADYSKLLKDMQTHFDAYKQEAATDHALLKQHLERLSREKSELQTDIARASSQVTLAHERYEMLQSNYKLLKSENAELQKRSQHLAEVAAKQDLRTQQVAEELVEAKGLADSMRNETANLKAERELAKKIEARLTEDNQALVEERSRLNKMISDLQNLQNERQLSDSESRRKLQTRVDALESELTSAKRKLDDEVEEAKKAVLRREFEQEQSRTRIDDLMKTLANVREELVAAKTTRDQLQARVDEMRIELRSAEERVQALQPRPSTRPQDTVNGDMPGEHEETLSREQALTIEVSELKRDLEIAQVELENAKTDVENYQEISRTAEEELRHLNSTFDDYKEDMDKLLSERDAKIKDLEQRMEDISSELATTNTELSQIRTKHEEGAASLAEQKRIFDAELARIKDENERLSETAKMHQEDLKAQAEIAQQAQQNYENELVKHADAAKALQTVRTEYNALRTEVAKVKAEAEAAKATLSQSEESWSEVKERYENELSELRARREDVNAQNKILHQQLENVSAQIAALQKNRSATPAEGEAPAAPGSDLENLQEVIKYLRREKEIVDVQHEISIQESKRLQQQLDYTQAQLEETRQKLNQERQMQANKDQSVMNHNKLLHTIEELNVMRESNTTLRAEARQAQTQLAEKTAEVERIIAQLEPLQTRVREVENELETKDGEYKLLQEDRDRWQKRTQDILHKYDRVDPEELENLKNQIINLTTERDGLKTEIDPLKEQLAGVDARIEEAKAGAREELKTRLVEQFKARSRELSGQIKDSKRDNENLSRERDELTQQLSAVKAELEQVKVERDEAVARAFKAEEAATKIPQPAEQPDTQMQNGDVEEGEVGGLSQEEQQALEERLNAAEAKAREEAENANGLRQTIETLQDRITQLQNEVAELQQRLDTANAELTELKNQPQQSQQPQPVSADNAEHLEKLRTELATAQSEVETLRLNASVQANATSSTDTGEKSVADQVTEQVASIRADLEAKFNERVQAEEAKFQSRADNMKKQLSEKLKLGKDAVRQELTQKHEADIQELKQQHAAEVQRLIDDHKQEIDRISQLHEAALVQAKEEAAKTSAAQPPSSEPTADSSRVAAPESQPDAPVKTEGAKLDLSQLPDDEMRALIADNPVVKKIVANNIQKRLGVEREAIVAKTREEYEKEAQEKIAQLRRELEAEREKIIAEKLEEANTKAEAAKANAVVMEGKRHGVKLSMAEGKARNLQAKVDVVQQAATETPEKPVGEVWEVAKNAKPPPAQAQQQQTPALTKQPSVSHAAPQQPSSPAPSRPQSALSGPPASNVQQNAPAPAPTAPQNPAQPGSQPPPPVSPAYHPAQQQQGAQPHQTSNATPQQFPIQPQQPQVPQFNQPPGQPQQNNNLQRPPNQHTGTGPAALRGILGGQTGIPRAGSNIPRGGGRGGRGGFGQPSQLPGTMQPGQPQVQGQQHLPQTPMAGNQNQHQNPNQNQRGRGGRGRGGPNRGGQHQNQNQNQNQNQQVNTQLPQAMQQGQGQNSPGGLNPVAKQFTPGGPGGPGGPGQGGAKRQREDSADDGGPKKRRGSRDGGPGR